MDFLEPIQDYLFYSAVLSSTQTISSSMDTATTAASLVSESMASSAYLSMLEATPAPDDGSFQASTEDSLVSESVSLIEAETTSASALASKTMAAAAFIPASGFFATLMNSFRSTALPPPPVGATANITDSTPDFVLKRLAQSFVSAIAQQSAETDIQDPKVSTFVSYLVSPFAILCICMAILLNRTVVFATTRRPAPLTLPYRLILRSVAIYFLASRTVPLISAITCTASPIAQYIPSYFETKTCPTPTVLWDLYWGICVGHFIETFSSVIQGQTPHSETGMTLFEYSMAFQEVQSSSRMSMEVLVVAITSSLSLLTLHTFGAFNMYNYRLIPSTIFGASFLTYFGWSVFSNRVFYFPTVCIIGYLPQLIMSVIIFMCGIIYGLACLLGGGAGNLSTSWKHVNISLKDDFYSCLFKVGVVALTTTSQATFINETALINQPTYTWIEREDSKDKAHGESSVNQSISSVPILAPSLLHASQDDISRFTLNSSLNSMSPYSRETPLPPDLAGPRKRRHDGAIEPPKLLTLYRITSVFKMMHGMLVILIHLVLKILWNIGFKYVLPSSKTNKSYPDGQPIGSAEALERVKNQVVYSTVEDDEGNWKTEEPGYQELLWGHLIPDVDNSKSYKPDALDDGFSTDEEGLEYESDYEGGSSNSHSTNYISHVSYQRQPFSSTPFADKPKSTLAELYDLIMPSPQDLLALLAPQTPQQIENKRLLISHLEEHQDTAPSSSLSGDQPSKSTQVQRTRPVTRSQYKRRIWDESKALLHTIETRRRKFVVDDEIRETLCVVCQCSTRQVILWPCRCLAVCEECRMALVAQNFKGCVCCRRDVKSFSRIFVP